MRKTPEGEGVVPATYALPRGTPALQGAVWYSRRSFIAVVAGSVGMVGTTAYLLGRLRDSESPSEAEMAERLAELELAWAHAVAQGPIDVLLRDYVSFLACAEAHLSDEALWLGMERLADAALIEEGPQAERVLARLLASFRNLPVPGALKAVIPRLEMRLQVLRGRD